MDDIFKYKVDTKKASILYVLKVLEDHSGEDHYLTQQQIIDYIKSEEYNGPEVARKSIASSIELLNEIGFNVDKGDRNGFALLDHTYDSSEINFLVDAVFSSKLVPSSYAWVLASKLTNELPVYERGTFNNLYKTNDVGRSFLNDIFLNISTISQAIDKGRKISFQYLNYASPTTTKEKYTQKQYIVNPYYIVNMRGDYYLILNYDKYDGKSMYHIERMKDIKILDEPIKEMRDVKAFNGFDIAKFLNEHIYPFINDEVVNAKVILKGDMGVHYAVEWFGNNVTSLTKIDDDTSSAFIKCDYGSLAFWCLQYPDNVQAMSPKILLDYIRKELDQLNKNYPVQKKEQ